MSEQSDDIIKNIDAIYEKVKEDDKKALILLSIQNWLYNIIKFDEITGDEIYSSLDEMLYATQYYFDTFDKKTAHDFLSIIINYVENTGAAFGILKNMRWLFVLTTLIMIVILYVWFNKSYFKNEFMKNYKSVSILGFKTAISINKEKMSKKILEIIKITALKMTELN